MGKNIVERRKKVRETKRKMTRKSKTERKADNGGG